MARIISYRFLTQNPALCRQQSPLPSPSLLINRHQARTLTNTPTIQSAGADREEDIVIVGGGIAGLATALSLHRLGIKSLVLEQASELRTSGVSISLSKNAWSALDSIGVGDELRSQYYRIRGLQLKTDQGKELGTFEFNQEDQRQELRAVERKSLLLTLANHLPPESMQFASHISKIEPTETGDTVLRFNDGSRISAKIVVGCDGIRSQVAKWMGFGEPKYSGHHCFRGLGVYPEGHNLEPIVNYMYGRGMRSGFIPASPNKVYWFLCYNNPNPGLISSSPSFSSSPISSNDKTLSNSIGLDPQLIRLGLDTTDSSELKALAKTLVTGWPDDLIDIIDKTPDDAVFCNPLEDRWSWPMISPPPTKGRVVLTGDAWHPMTPNLGQGACCALEDAVALSKRIHHSIIGSGEMRIEDALKEYQKERWRRVFPVTVQSNLVGRLLQSESGLVCGFRNAILPRLLGARMRAVLEVGLPNESKNMVGKS